jgi:hypothetical protein
VATNTSETPIEIAQWLRELGLGQYAEAFRENAIDAKILRCELHAQSSAQSFHRP